ncbi:uncharacterized protein LY89DRAFT_710629 [Mollisia scopiformis]|uniref:Uncharacterized protein n=1 Tax=Mollisia scopiformis TaxID=149040 RepID=A0A132BCU4_MOLSC|nr:uncharacterized protein LY89DRAFT_710629 [Mollisia scopiformis]KUJ10252.1 hypothetical protein LY89DRAFT_710629 [Mollisia scopiformis]
MPPNPAAVGVVVAVSIVAAAAIAVYESPQARQFAEDVRRKIAIALHSLGDEINPQSRQPRFNRPEDAEGFLMSQAGADPGIDADEESKKRQREELMYWNAVHLEKKEKERQMNGTRPENRSRGSSFDDFLHEDPSGEKGTYVYNTGTDTNQTEGLRNRGVQGLNRGSFYANPFGDEHNIEMDEQRAIDASLMDPDMSEREEMMSDIYSANEDPRPSRQTPATIAEQLIDTSDDPVPDPPVSFPTMEDHFMGETTNFTNMATADRDDSAYASIHAWADNANHSFYSPLPVTPGAITPQQQEVRPSSPTFSDPDVSVPGSGFATPTDSASLAGSGEEIWAPRSGATSEADVMSVDGEGVSTPGTWTEVGSVVSEDDVGAGVHH